MAICFENRMIARRHWLVFAMLVSLGLITGCGKPPQIADSPEALKIADALWTAIGKQNKDLLTATAERVTQLAEAGSISPEAKDFLQDVIRRGESGDWDSAHKKLKSFIKGQRRVK